MNTNVAATSNNDEQFEDSIQLRIIVSIMAIMCISMGCAFVSTPLLMTLLYIFCAGTGSFLSYQYKQEKTKMLHTISLVGVLLVMANFIRELHYGSESGAFDIYTPFIHLAAGVFAAHTFELNSRSAINQSAALGLVLLCLMAPVGRSLYFGGCVTIYLCLGTVMLYYDSYSRTLRSSLWPTSAKALPIVANEAVVRRRHGNVILTIALLPLVSALAFVLVPRGDSLVDYIWSKISHQISEMTKPPEVPEQIKDAVPAQRQKFQPLFNSSPDSAQLMAQSRLKNRDLHRAQPPTPSLSSKHGKHQKGKAKDQTTTTISAPYAGLPDLSLKQNNVTAPNKNTETTANNSTNNSGTASTPGANGNKIMDLSHKYGLRPLYANPNELLFRVTSNRTVYFRRDCFDSFDGKQWTVSDKKDIDRFNKGANNQFIIDKSILKPDEQEKAGKKTLGFNGAITGLGTIRLEQNYQVENNIGSALPVAWLPQEVFYEGDHINVDLYGTVTVSSELRKGDRYKVISRFPIFDMKALAQVPRPTIKKEEHLRSIGHSYLMLLPQDESQEVITLAQNVARADGNWFVQSERIANYLRKNYQYDENPNRVSNTQNTDSSLNLADNFILRTKRGNCEDFTTAFVVMCRAAGIPARCVGGFAPGDYNRVTGTHDILAKYSHCWGEIFLPNAGWIPIDPTPGGSLPAKANEASFDLKSLQQTVLKNDATGKTGLSLSEVIFYGAVSIIFLLLFVLVGRDVLRQIIEWQKKRVGVHPAVRTFRQVISSLKSADLKVMPSDTPMEISKKFRWLVKNNLREGQSSSMVEKMDHFMETYEAVYFGNHQRMTELESTAKELRQLLGSAKKSK